MSEDKIKTLNLGDFPHIPNLFVVRHYTGHGVIESPYINREVYYSSDVYSDAQVEADRLFYEKNPDPHDSWTYDNYEVLVNSNHPVGKEEAARRKVINDASWKHIEGHPEEYDHHKVGDMTFITHKGSFDELNKHWKSTTLTPVTEEERAAICKKLGDFKFKDKP
jgi:hypothetical protein